MGQMCVHDISAVEKRYHVFDEMLRGFLFNS